MKPVVDRVPFKRDGKTIGGSNYNSSLNSSSSHIDQLDEHRYTRRWSVSKKGLHQTSGMAPMLAWSLAYLSYLIGYPLLDLTFIPSIIKESISAKHFRRFVNQQKVVIRSIYRVAVDKVYKTGQQCYEYVNYQWGILWSSKDTNTIYETDVDLFGLLYNLHLSIIIIIIFCKV